MAKVTFCARTHEIRLSSLPCQSLRIFILLVSVASCGYLPNLSFLTGFLIRDKTINKISTPLMFSSIHVITVLPAKFNVDDRSNSVWNFLVTPVALLFSFYSSSFVASGS